MAPVVSGLERRLQAPRGPVVVGAYLLARGHRVIAAEPERILPPPPPDRRALGGALHFPESLDPPCRCKSLKSQAKV